MTLGARVDGDGVRFAVFSGVADAVELCVFDEAGAETRQPLEPGDSEVWQTHVVGAGHGLRYGYRVRGPGRCDPAKLLLDPYARAIAGERHMGSGGARARRGLGPVRPAIHRARRAVRLGRRPTPTDPARRHDRLRDARQGLHEAASRRAPGTPRDVRRPGAPGRGRTPGAARGDRRAAAAGAPVRPRPGARRARAAQLLGLSVDRILRAAQRVRVGRRLQVDGQGAARRGTGGHPRRRLQPHRRGR